MTPAFRRDPDSGALIATAVCERDLARKLARLEARVNTIATALERLTTSLSATPLREDPAHVQPD